MDPAGRALDPRSITVFLIAVLALASAAPVAGIPGAERPEARGPVSQGLSGNVDADSVVMFVALQPDGSAEWRIEYRIRLATDNDTAAFEDMREDIRSNPEEYRERFAGGIRKTVSDAENATDREMAAGNFAVRTETRQLPNDYGIVSYTFEWTNFAATDGGTVRAGDALAGLFLDAKTTLQVEWPEGYRLRAVAPEPTDTRSRAVSWTGSLNFASGEPLVVVAPSSTSTPGGEPTTDPGSTPGGGNDVGGLPPWLLVAALVLASAPIAVWFSRRRRGHADRATGSVAEPGQPDDGSAGDAPDEGDHDESTDDGPPEELLSNEERVLKLLDEHGGRIKQQAVVETLGWTDAKTSQVVGKLREDGEIEVFRLGRENVLTLPDEEL